MARILIDNVTRRFDSGTVAVKDATLEINDGELLVLVGPSGCGKSTLLRMIAGLEEVTSGSIFIGPDEVTQLPPSQRDIAMVFQNYALYPHMTVRDNLSFGLRMRNKAWRSKQISSSDILQKVDETARLLSIEDLLDRLPKQLSGGQRQRVAVGRAIVRDPAAFLFDEPLSNLDARLRIQMRTELANLHQQLKTTTVFVTHDQVEAMLLGQRIAVMKNGVIQQVAEPLRIYHQPVNRFVASFIGSPPMNFLEGQVLNDRFEFGKVGIDSPPSIGKGKVTLGFRPEHLRMVTSTNGQQPGRDSQQDPLQLATAVSRCERTGNETLLYFDIENQPCVARLTGDQDFDAGSSITLDIPTERLHWFDEHGNRCV